MTTNTNTPVKCAVVGSVTFGSTISAYQTARENMNTMRAPRARAASDALYQHELSSDTRLRVLADFRHARAELRAAVVGIVVSSARRGLAKTDVLARVAADLDLLTDSGIIDADETLADDVIGWIVELYPSDPVVDLLPARSRTLHRDVVPFTVQNELTS